MVNTEAAKVKTVNATVEIATSVGGEKKGKVTDYQQISGYILLRKPNALRMIGLFPLVRNKAFDMVSDGDEFKLSIPLRSKFYIGHNDVVHPVANPLENLRPGVIYNALLIPEISGPNQIAVMEDSTETVVDPKSKQLVEQPDYVLDVVAQTNGIWYLTRKIIFDRSTMTPHRQLIYDKDGNITTEATYQVFHDYNGISFPNVIQIDRPQEEYSITLTVTKLTLNEPLRDDQFVLQQPAGSILVNLDLPQNAAVRRAP
jgi:outer membrane lipoprotein-sorting protein